MKLLPQTLSPKALLSLHHHCNGNISCHCHNVTTIISVNKASHATHDPARARSGTTTVHSQNTPSHHKQALAYASIQTPRLRTGNTAECVAQHVNVPLVDRGNAQRGRVRHRLRLTARGCVTPHTAHRNLGDNNPWLDRT